MNIVSLEKVVYALSYTKYRKSISASEKMSDHEPKNFKKSSFKCLKENKCKTLKTVGRFNNTFV